MKVVFPSEGHIFLHLQAGHEHAVMVVRTRPACSEKLGVEAEPGSQALLSRALAAHSVGGVPPRTPDLSSEGSLHSQACTWKTQGVLHCRLALLQPGNILLSQRRQVSPYVPSADSQCPSSFPSSAASALLGSPLEIETLKSYPMPKVGLLEWAQNSRS